MERISGADIVHQSLTGVLLLTEMFQADENLPSPGGTGRLLRSSSAARNRWRRLKQTVAVASQFGQLK